MPRLALLLTTLVWGATFPATKVVLEQLPPLSFLFLRFCLGALLVVVGMLLLGFPFRRERCVVRASAIATVWLFLGYLLQTVGLWYTTASNSAFITALYVVFVPLILRRFGWRVWVATGIAIAGLWLLVKPTVAMNAGDLLTLGCAVAFAAHIACLERFTREVDAPSLFAWQMVAMAVILFPAMMLERAPAGSFAPTAALLVGLGITGGLATGAFAVQMWAQRLIPAQQVALVFASEPVYAAWLSWYFLGESLDLQGWIGSGLIVAAVVVGGFAAESHGEVKPVESLQTA
jgi:drug/metabolite transporter (DMT)-like permease